MRILINQMRIERTILGRNRQEGEQLLRQLDGGGTAWTPDGFRLIRFPYVVNSSYECGLMFLSVKEVKIHRLLRLTHGTEAAFY